MPLPEFKMRMTAAAALSPSEDPAKVRSAVGNILGDCKHTIEENLRSIRMSSEESASLVRIHDQLRDRHVRAAARRLLIASREGSRATLLFNRQAAHAGIVALCGSEAESPLGPIVVMIESDHLDEIVEWLTAYEVG
jgi:predicted RNA binding protein with dsRBD fold (UPF0201 family)